MTSISPISSASSYQPASAAPPVADDKQDGVKKAGGHHGHHGHKAAPPAPAPAPIDPNDPNASTSSILDVTA